MSIHIGAKQGDIAETILLPGDPLRAKFIAETFFEDVIQYNHVRGMLGYTGTYKGMRISVQGTGMGVPSISIYLNELMNEYNVQTLVRVGTCGAMQHHIKVRDIVLAQCASTDSQVNRHVFGGIDFAPAADFDLLRTAYGIATDKNLSVHVGNVYTTDLFYSDNKDEVNRLLEKYNVMAVEMETSALYTLAAKYNRKALSILTASDHVLTNETTTSEERETAFTEMMELALDTVTA